MFKCTTTPAACNVAHDRHRHPEPRSSPGTPDNCHCHNVDSSVARNQGPAGRVLVGTGSRRSTTSCNSSCSATIMPSCFDSASHTPPHGQPRYACWRRYVGGSVWRCVTALSAGRIRMRSSDHDSRWVGMGRRNSRESLPLGTTQTPPFEMAN